MKEYQKGENDYVAQEVDQLFEEHDKDKNDHFDKEELKSFIRFVAGLGEDPYKTQPEAIAILENVLNKEQVAEEEIKQRKSIILQENQAEMVKELQEAQIEMDAKNAER